MRDYVELVKALRCCSQIDARNNGCDSCPYEYCGDDCQNLCGCAADAIEELLAELTTIRKQLPRWTSVEELLAERTAFWVDTQPHMDDFDYKKDGMSYYCSNCHHRAGKYKHRSYKFCPWCGAKIVPKEMAVRNED